MTPGFPFSPKDRGTQTVVASTTTATCAVSASAPSLRIVNASGATAFLRFGTATATSSDVPMLNGTVEVFAGGVDRVDVILIAGAAGGSVYITEGTGT